MTITAMTLTSYIKIIASVTFHNFAYISAVLGTVLTKFRPTRWHLDRQQKSLIIFRTMLPFSPISHRNDDNMAGNKNDMLVISYFISADLANVGQCHRLQISIHFSYYNQTFNWGWQQKRHIGGPWKCRSRSHFITSNISALLKLI